MSRLDIILSAALTLSVLLNIGLLVYARTAIIRIISVSEEMGDLQAMVEAFTGHLKAIYELEMFYGDQTLQGLLEHALSFNEYMNTFEDIISLTEEAIEKAPEENQEETTDDEKPQEENPT